MNKGKYIVIGLIAVVVVVGAMLYASKSAPTVPSGPKATPSGQTPQPLATLPPATGGVDDTVNAILQGTSGDEFAAEENDAQLLSENDQALTEFGQSLNGAQF